jgi:hypothetical protein
MNKKQSAHLILLGLALSVSFALISCRGMFFDPQSRYEKSLREQPFDAIIVPGVPFENKNWSFIMKGRVLWSVYLYKKGYAKNIIYSGSAVYSPFVEGKIMALYAEKLGVKPENIFVESKAEHSTENIFYSSLIAKSNGFTKVALATDRFQSRTLADFLPKIKRKIDVEVKSLPMQEDLVSAMPQYDPVIDYELARVDSFVSLVERESKLKRLWGTLGKNINYKEAGSYLPTREAAAPAN